MISEPRTAGVIARDVERATNKATFCRTQCARIVDENWDTQIKHDPECPLA